MFHEQKNNFKPSASMDLLRYRAEVLQKIRDFFKTKKVLEVETPLLSHGTVTDPYVLSIPAMFQTSISNQTVYLQTSPEYAMKRLLASGSGCIFQMTKSFRQGDISPLHNPEFTMLEWYRVGYDHHKLMQEMDEFLQQVIKAKPAVFKTYQAIFLEHCHLDPHQTNIQNIILALKHFNVDLNFELTNLDQGLQLLFTHVIEPKLGLDAPCIIFDFPSSQAALAKIRYDETPVVASRFEVYYKGLELANGFHELQDAQEQRNRFEKDLQKRLNDNLPSVPIDENFLQSLENGLPDCAGVALGIDRLLMAHLDIKQIKEVMSFDFNCA